MLPPDRGGSTFGSFYTRSCRYMKHDRHQPTRTREQKHTIVSSHTHSRTHTHKHTLILTHTHSHTLTHTITPLTTSSRLGRRCVCKWLQLQHQDSSETTPAANTRPGQTWIVSCCARIGAASAGSRLATSSKSVCTFTADSALVSTYTASMLEANSRASSASTCRWFARSDLLPAIAMTMLRGPCCLSSFTHDLTPSKDSCDDLHQPTKPLRGTLCASEPCASCQRQRSPRLLLGSTWAPARDTMRQQSACQPHPGSVVHKAPHLFLSSRVLHAHPAHRRQPTIHSIAGHLLTHPDLELECRLVAKRDRLGHERRPNKHSRQNPPASPTNTPSPKIAPNGRLQRLKRPQHESLHK
jgi:hypothetical protein